MTVLLPNERLFKLCHTLDKQDIAAFLVPVNDEFQGEYTPDYAKRLEWLSGFSGSAGTAVVWATPKNNKHAALLVDGRYTLQAAQTMDAAYEVLNSSDVPLPVCLTKHLVAGQVVAFDPWLHTRAQVRRLREALEPMGIKLLALKKNLIDTLWHDQPAPPSAPIVPHPLELAGESSASKRARVMAELKAHGAHGVMLTLPDGIHWLLNIRGADIAFNPMALCFAWLDVNDRLIVFTYPRTSNVWADDLSIEVVAMEDMEARLGQLLVGGTKVMIDSTSAAEWFFRKAERAQAKIIEKPDPTQAMKAIKNNAEIEGMRAAHKRDGASLTAFLKWLGAQKNPSELEVMEVLENFRKSSGGNLYRGKSFETIAGSGANGAIVHYRADESSNRRVQDGELFLIDSGGQYADGTTDVTRTVVFGTPTDEMKDRFTRVLKGHIAIATAVFPVGTTGSQLDALARQFLWQVGCDYDHGTGHGVGAYLCVHEGPQRISKRGGDVPLAAGMIISNEPGYYKAGEYGIRIENLVLVVERSCKLQVASEGRKMLGFETLTLAPLDEKLIAWEMLSEAEAKWVRDYQSLATCNS